MVASTIRAKGNSPAQSNLYKNTVSVNNEFAIYVQRNRDDTNHATHAGYTIQWAAGVRGINTSRRSPASRRLALWSLSITSLSNEYDAMSVIEHNINSHIRSTQYKFIFSPNMIQINT